MVPQSIYPYHDSTGISSILAVCLSLSGLLLAIRIYTRLRILRAFYPDDYIIITAWLFNAASTVARLEQENITDATIHGRCSAASMLLYIPATALPKIAILLTYLRVFPSKNVRIGSYIILFVTMGYVISSYLGLGLHCYPLARFWDKSIPGDCTLIPQLLANAILNVAIDFMVLLVPVRTLIKWNVNWRIKSLMGGMMAIGSLTCIVSAVRVYYVAHLLDTFETTHAILTPITLGLVETNISVICGCLMVMRPFLRRHFPFLLGISPEHLEHESTGVVGDEHHMTEFCVSIESRPKTSAGFGMINSSAGWVWNRGSINDNHGTDRTTTSDLEIGGEVGWPLKNNTSPDIERGNNALGALDYHKTSFAQAIKVLDSHFERNGEAEIQARTASFAATFSPYSVRETDLATILE